MTNIEISNELNRLFIRAISSLPKRKFTSWLCGFYGIVEVRTMHGRSVQEYDIKHLKENLRAYKKEASNEKRQPIYRDDTR